MIEDVVRRGATQRLGKVMGHRVLAPSPGPSGSCPRYCVMLGHVTFGRCLCWANTVRHEQVSTQVNSGYLGLSRANSAYLGIKNVCPQPRLAHGHLRGARVDTCLGLPDANRGQWELK